MITLILPRPVQDTIRAALLKAGRREIGGILMAEHVGPNVFEVKDLTVHRRGTVFNFVRVLEDALSRLRAFFERAEHDYTRFNYIGEWHSHPSFVPSPSPRDDASMREIVEDPKVGANFVVLLIVKLESPHEMASSVHTYLPDGTKHTSILVCID
jgi:[CysO sulfur-carrier protein]-S-L-cysteine hydrolase